MIKSHFQCKNSVSATFIGTSASLMSPLLFYDKQLSNGLNGKSPLTQAASAII